MDNKEKRIESLHVGLPQPIDYNGKEVMTAFRKKQVMEPIMLWATDFAGDEQGDPVNHGGPDKAVCVYASEHYPYWERELGGKLGFGAFGENVTVSGMLEKDVCIGDIFRLGDAVVQISQPRQPCYKMAHRHERPDLPELVQQTGYTGYYFRVLQEGVVIPGSGIELLERHPMQVTVEFANRIKYHDKRNLAGIRTILAVNVLSASWRMPFESRLAELERAEASD